MSNANTSNSVFRLKHGNTTNIPGIKEPFTFPNGQEFHIVGDVMYMGGFPLPMWMQKPFIEWVKKNPNLFINDTRIF